MFVFQGERGPNGPATVGPRGIPGIPGERGEPVSVALSLLVCLSPSVLVAESREFNGNFMKTIKFSGTT